MLLVSGVSVILIYPYISVYILIYIYRYIL